MTFFYGNIIGSEPDIALVEKRLKGGWFRKGYTINEIFERVELVFSLFPVKKVTVKILPTAHNVRALYKERYNRVLKSSAFMSKSLNTVWISARDVTPLILAHEFAHCVFEGNQCLPISGKCHEAVAQFVEREVFKL